MVRGVLALSYETPTDGTPIEAFVDGQSTVFLNNKNGKTFIVVPPVGSKQSGWSVALNIATAGGLIVRRGFGAESKPVLALLIAITIKKSGSIAEVWVNSQSRTFTQTSGDTVLCEPPDNLTSIDSIEVLTDSPTIGTATGFTYALQDNLKTVAGAQKLVFQFVKLLMTTQGTDLFHQAEGGNLQKIPGMPLEQDGAGSLGAQILLAVNRTTAYMIGGQTLTSLPAEERLTKATIGNLIYDRNDPTSVTVSLRLENLARESAVFNFLTKTAGGN
jgi:hypothetical protein